MSSVNLLIQQMFIEHLLYGRQNSQRGFQGNQDKPYPLRSNILVKVNIQ